MICKSALEREHKILRKYNNPFFHNKADSLWIYSSFNYTLYYIVKYHLDRYTRFARDEELIVKIIKYYLVAVSHSMNNFLAVLPVELHCLSFGVFSRYRLADSLFRIRKARVGVPSDYQQISLFDIYMWTISLFSCQRTFCALDSTFCSVIEYETIITEIARSSRYMVWNDERSRISSD